MIEFVWQCYEEYKRFMDLKTDILPQIIPSVIIRPENETGKYPYAFVNEDEIGNDPINIYYDSNLSNKSKDFIKAILFHEFTHILDGLTFKDMYDNRNYMAIMATYSEYHAAQIELACKAKFKNIRSFRKIDLNKTYVPCEDSMHKIESDYIEPMADSLLVIEKACDYYYDLSCVEYFRYYKVFESKLMYYLGKKNFCAKYSLKREPDITQKAYGDFYPYIHDIEICIQNKNFDKLLELKLKLWNNYLSVFKLKKEELDILLQSLTIK